MSQGTFKVQDRPQVFDFISWIMPLWTMFGKDLTAVLSFGEGWDDQCSMCLAQRPKQSCWGWKKQSREGYGLSLQAVSSAQPLLGYGSMVG
jgi:hypothetical protein